MLEKGDQNPGHKPNILQVPVDARRIHGNPLKTQINFAITNF